MNFLSTIFNSLLSFKNQTLSINSLNGNRYQVRINFNKTVKQLKILIKELTKVDVQEQTLIFGAETLKDEKTLIEYKICQKDSLYLITHQKQNLQVSESTQQENEQQKEIPDQLNKCVRISLF